MTLKSDIKLVCNGLIKAHQGMMMMSYSSTDGVCDCLTCEAARRVLNEIEINKELASENSND